MNKYPLAIIILYLFIFLSCNPRTKTENTSYFMVGDSVMRIDYENVGDFLNTNKGAIPCLKIRIRYPFDGLPNPYRDTIYVPYDSVLSVFYSNLGYCEIMNLDYNWGSYYYSIKKIGYRLPPDPNIFEEEDPDRIVWAEGGYTGGESWVNGVIFNVKSKLVLPESFKINISEDGIVDKIELVNGSIIDCDEIILHKCAIHLDSLYHYYIYFD